MNRIILTILFILSTTHIYSLSFYELNKYRVPSYDTVEEYQNLIGKTYTFIPVFNSHNYRMVKKFSFRRIFKIDNIKKSRTHDEGVVKTSWTISDISNGEKFKIIVYIGNRSELEKNYANIPWDDEVRNYEIPLYDLDKWKQDHASLIGSSYTHPLVKASYKVLDCNIDIIEKNYDEIVKVQNSIDKKCYIYRLSTAQQDCFRDDLERTYFSTLTMVDKPKNPEIKYGEIQSVTDSLTKYSYEDNFISVIIYGNSKNFSFSIKNNTQYSIKIIWDEAVFVDLKGSTSKIMHNGIKYSERENSQSPSTIIRGASLDDIAVPTRNVFYADNLKDWRIQSMYPDQPTEDTYQLRLMLPIQIKEVVNEYVFVFDVKYEYLHPERLNL